MTESKNRQWILNSRPAGKLTGEEFRWNEARVPEPSDGQMLVRASADRIAPETVTSLVWPLVTSGTSI